MTDRSQILENVRSAIGGKFPLYNLGFGQDVDFDFLEVMSMENNGRAQRIYEDHDATQQLQVSSSPTLPCPPVHHQPQPVGSPPGQPLAHPPRGAEKALAWARISYLTLSQLLNTFELMILSIKCGSQDPSL